jgi:murein DD-endopeptidase MepM/ murein hydrolase activator NlpD
MDYKPEPVRPDLPRQLRSRLKWFALGLGVPALGVLLAMSARNAGGTQQQARIASASLVTASLELPLPGTAPALPPAPAVVPAAPAVQSTLLALKVVRGDTLDGLFRTHGLDRRDLASMMRVKDVARPLQLLRPGDEILVSHDAGSVLSLDRRLDETRRLSVTRSGADFTAQILEDAIERRLQHTRGRIDSSLFEAGMRSGLSDRLLMQLAGIFAWDIDFVLDIRRDDEFAVVYEEIWRDGALQRTGEVVAAEFVNAGRVFRAVRFVDPTGRADYYAPDGRSMRKAFLRAPVDFSRISSNFNLKRLHPIFKTVRPHRGVDYAAPAGTPIKAAGDGKVIFRGQNGGYGNAVVLQHGGNITTLYGHMSRFADGARAGARVRQGQTIGYVGQTGYATGPHLHYEYQLNGVHRNPRTIPLPQAEPISSEYREDFLTASAPLLTRLDVVKRTQLAAYEDE